jgi:PEGA domain-containing protein
MSRVLALVACGFTLAACSTSLSSLSLPSMDFFKSSPPTETVRIESQPPGAEAKTTQGQTCRTPCEMTVQTEGNVSVTVALNGYQPQTVPLHSENVQTGESSASTAKLAPNPVYVELQANPPPPVKKRKTATVKRKPTATAEAPAAATQSAAATASPPPMTAEPAPCSVNANAYPWPAR